MAKNPPVHEIRLGFIKVSIWRNDTRSGERHNITASRLFKDGDTWRSSDHFGRDDLLLLCKAIDQAHSWIYQQAQAGGGEP
jgi:hypothetical protein